MGQSRPSGLGPQAESLIRSEPISKQDELRLQMTGPLRASQRLDRPDSTLPGGYSWWLALGLSAKWVLGTVVPDRGSLTSHSALMT